MSIKEELSGIFDGDRIVDDSGILSGAMRNDSFVGGGMPACVVRPKGMEEVQGLIRWANDKRMPLTPVSSGVPHVRGGSTPLFGGVCVDLSGMDRVLMVDREYRVAMVEPGVTFYELRPELEKAGLKLPMPLSPRGTKSVLGSVMEREPITIPKYHVDMSAPLLCAEVVFGTGDLFRTGEASGPGNIEEQREAKRKQVWDSGPGQISFSRILQGAQGSMGIVTWITVRCEVLPTVQEFLFIPARDVSELTDFVYRILRRKLGDECFMLNGFDVASFLGEGEGIRSLSDELPGWLLVLGISGYEFYPEERVLYQKEAIVEAARQFGLAPKAAVPGMDAFRFLKGVEGPTEPYWKRGYKGSYCDIFFLTTMDRVGGFIHRMQDICNERRYDVRELGIYIQPINQGRSCHCEFRLSYDADNLKEAERVKGLFDAASEAMMKAGGFFSRPYGNWAGMAYNRDAASREAVRKLKGIFDPNDIMNPGKLC